MARPNRCTNPCSSSSSAARTACNRTRERRVSISRRSTAGTEPDRPGFVPAGLGGRGLRSRRDRTTLRIVAWPEAGGLVVASPPWGAG
jgi:hypothetical protein